MDSDTIYDTLCRVCLDVKRCQAALMFLTRTSFGHSCLNEAERKVEALAVNELRERLRIIGGHLIDIYSSPAHVPRPALRRSGNALSGLRP